MTVLIDDFKEILIYHAKLNPYLYIEDIYDVFINMRKIDIDNNINFLIRNNVVQYEDKTTRILIQQKTLQEQMSLF